jgi:hypothetical protein
MFRYVPFGQRSELEHAAREIDAEILGGFEWSNRCEAGVRMGQRHVPA